MREITLTQGYVALIDDGDFEAVNSLTWHILRCRRVIYAAHTLPNRKTLLMHRFLLPESIEVAHRDGNGLNNQRFNIRPCTPAQNRQGSQQKAEGKTSVYRGVSWDSAREKWKSEIKKDRVKRFLGRFEAEQDAAEAYNKAARSLFGEHASPNNI